MYVFFGCDELRQNSIQGVFLCSMTLCNDVIFFLEICENIIGVYYKEQIIEKCPPIVIVSIIIAL